MKKIEKIIAVCILAIAAVSFIGCQGNTQTDDTPEINGGGNNGGGNNGGGNNGGGSFANPPLTKYSIFRYGRAAASSIWNSSRDLHVLPFKPIPAGWAAV